MKKLLRNIRFYLHAIRLLPHYCLFKYKCSCKDTETLKYVEDTRYFAKEGGSFRILNKRPEYMSVLYARLIDLNIPLKCQQKLSGRHLHRPSSLHILECGKDRQEF